MPDDTTISRDEAFRREMLAMDERNRRAVWERTHAPRPKPDDPWNADPLLTTYQTADYLGVPRQTLAVWRSRRPLVGPAHMKVGRYIRYRLSEIDAWLDSQRTDPAALVTRA